VIALVVAIAVVLALPVAVIWLVGTIASAPQNRMVGPLPADLVGDEVAFGGLPDASLRGWFLPGRAEGAVIVVMHGIRDDRRGMLDRGRFLQAAGYSVLLFDFQAHGESWGDAITFGYRESRNAAAAVAFVRSKRPGAKIAVIGISLGGAAALLAAPPLAVDALVLEAVFPTIEDAIGDRIAVRLGDWARALTPLFTWQFAPRLGVGVAQLRPIAAIGGISVPKLIIAGTADRHTRLAESRALYAAAAQPAEFWPIEGAAHVNFHDFAGAAYEARVLDFLDRTLR
jgi:pimeloyl-ACP methyl ester carboxylesterase